MSHYDYVRSIQIAIQDEPFYALIMAAMRQADTDNLARLQLAFPGVYEELRDRIMAEGGRLPGEPLEMCPWDATEPCNGLACNEACPHCGTLVGV